MADLVYKFDEVDLMPITGISFWDDDNDEGLHFYHIESDSDWGGLRAITKQHYMGGQKNIAWRCQPMIYIVSNPLNKYDWALIKRLEKLKNRYVDTYITLGDIVNYENSPPPMYDPLPTAINATHATILKFSNKLMFNYEIEQVQFRPRLCLKPEGIIQNILEVVTEGSETAKMFFNIGT